MYAWWSRLIVLAMFQMLFTGILAGRMIRIRSDFRKEKNVEKNERSLSRCLALLPGDAAVSVFIIIQAARYECPLFLAYRLWYEYIIIGLVVYGFWHLVCTYTDEQKAKAANAANEANNTANYQH